MRELADMDMPITLAVSLHAPNDESRRRIMPVASAYSVREVVEAAKYYFERTGRRVSFEYSLMEGVNDGVEQAEELGRLLEDFPCHVNIIPINTIEGAPYRRSPEVRIQLFEKSLRSAGIQVTRRRELGHEIGGACGQLKRGYVDTLQR
jgi:23S rRNA (adenine2503-C2)-methyltransferase